MSGWDAQLEAAPPPAPVPEPPKRKKKKKKKALAEGTAEASDGELSQAEAEDEEQLGEETEEPKSATDIGEELSEKLNKVSQKFLSLKKSAGVIGSGKPWPQDSSEVRIKIMKKLDDLKTEVRETTKNQRSAIARTNLDKKFRDNLEQGITQLDTDLKAFIVTIKQKAQENPAPPKPVVTTPDAKAAEEIDPLDQLQIVQDEEDVEAELQQEKNEGLLELEESFDACADVINDLAVMVHEQGELIEKIETNVSTAKDNVHDGVQSLADAKKYQAEARKKMAMMGCGFVLAIVGGVVGLIIYLKASPMGEMQEVQMQKPTVPLGTTDIQVPRRATRRAMHASLHAGQFERGPDQQTLSLLEKNIEDEYKLSRHSKHGYSGVFSKALNKMGVRRDESQQLLFSLDEDIEG